MSETPDEEQFEEAALSGTPHVFVQGEVNSEFVLQIYVADQFSGHPCFPLLLVAEFEGKTLVAVPHQAWHRSQSRRKMGVAGALSKPTAVEVLAAKLDAPMENVEGISCSSSWCLIHQKPSAISTFWKRTERSTSL